MKIFGHPPPKTKGHHKLQVGPYARSLQSTYSFWTDDHDELFGLANGVSHSQFQINCSHDISMQTSFDLMMGLPYSWLSFKVHNLRNKHTIIHVSTLHYGCRIQISTQVTRVALKQWSCNVEKMDGL